MTPVDTTGWLFALAAHALGVRDLLDRHRSTLLAAMAALQPQGLENRRGCAPVMKANLDQAHRHAVRVEVGDDPVAAAAFRAVEVAVSLGEQRGLAGPARTEALGAGGADAHRDGQVRGD